MTRDRIAQQINAEHQQITSAVRGCLPRAKRAGDLLRQAREGLEHGEWLPWLRAHVECDQATAWRYMAIAEHWDKLCTVHNLTLREALRLLAGKATPPAEQPETLPSLPHDYLGLPVRDDLLPVFAAIDLWDEAGQLLDRTAALLGQLAADPGGEILRDFPVPESVKEARARLDNARPYAGICPHCQEELTDEPQQDCPACRGRGWVTRGVWEWAPAAARQRLLAAHVHP